MGELPTPTTATGSGENVVFTHVYSTVYDVYAVSSEGLFRLDAGGNDWTIEQVSGLTVKVIPGTIHFHLLHTNRAPKYDL